MSGSFKDGSRYNRDFIVWSFFPNQALSFGWSRVEILGKDFQGNSSSDRLLCVTTNVRRMTQTFFEGSQARKAGSLRLLVLNI